jgi:dipeptidyl aminopeptidase/acylaminoacyl peptidase
MTRAHDFDDVIRDFLADEARQVPHSAPSLEMAAARVAPHLEAPRTHGSRLQLILVAALLLLAAIASTVAIGSALRLILVDDLPPARGNGVIAYPIDGTIFVRDVHASSGHPLIEGEELVSALAFSPDGSRLAFLRENDTETRRTLWVADADGSDARRLTEREFENWQFEWSADGQRIAIGGPDGASSAVAVVNTRSGASDVVPSTDVRASEVHWSPDGTIIYVSDVSGSGADASIFAVAVDGGPVTRVLRLDGTGGGGTGPPVQFAVSPDGRYVAAGSDGLHLVAIGSGEVRTHPDLSLVPTFSPDGRWLVAQTWMGDGVLRAFIGRVGEFPDGMRPLDPATEGSARAVFSPDSRYLLLLPLDAPFAWLVDLEEDTTERLDWPARGNQFVSWQGIGE